MNNPAPIVLFVYNRPIHTEKTLEALSENHLADKSVLYIFSDGAKDANVDDIKSVNRTREIIKSRNWCKEVIIVESKENKGLAKSIIDGVTDVVDKFGKVIVLEDDIKTSKYFLQFLNEGLLKYSDNSLIAGISGFSYPSTKKNKDIYFLPIGCSWGWGTWKRQWDEVSFDSNVLLTRVLSEGLKDKMNFGGYPFYEMLENQRDGKINSWAIRFYASFFLQDKMFVYPPESMVQNIGFDSQATHTTESESFFSRVSLGTYIANWRSPQLDEYSEGVKEAFELQYKPERSNGRSSLLKRVFRKIRSIIQS